MTGNFFNAVPWTQALTLAMGKTSSAQLIWYASIAYANHDFKFYYADERQADGSPSVPVDGPAAAEAYVELAEKKEQGPWDYTFVKGKGYVQLK